MSNTNLAEKEEKESKQTRLIHCSDSRINVFLSPLKHERKRKWKFKISRIFNKDTHQYETQSIHHANSSMLYHPETVQKYVSTLYLQTKIESLSCALMIHRNDGSSIFNKVGSKLMEFANDVGDKISNKFFPSLQQTKEIRKIDIHYQHGMITKKINIRQKVDRFVGTICKDLKVEASLITVYLEGVKPLIVGRNIVLKTYQIVNGSSFLILQHGMGGNEEVIVRNWINHAFKYPSFRFPQFSKIYGLFKEKGIETLDKLLSTPHKSIMVIFNEMQSRIIGLPQFEERTISIKMGLLIDTIETFQGAGKGYAAFRDANKQFGTQNEDIYKNTAMGLFVLQCLIYPNKINHEMIQIDYEAQDSLALSLQAENLFDPKVLIQSNNETWGKLHEVFKVVNGGGFHQIIKLQQGDEKQIQVEMINVLRKLGIAPFVINSWQNGIMEEQAMEQQQQNESTTNYQNRNSNVSRSQNLNVAQHSEISSNPQSSPSLPPSISSSPTTNTISQSRKRKFNNDSNDISQQPLNKRQKLNHGHSPMTTSSNTAKPKTNRNKPSPSFELIPLNANQSPQSSSEEDSEDDRTIDRNNKNALKPLNAVNPRSCFKAKNASTASKSVTFAEDQNQNFQDLFAHCDFGSSFEEIFGDNSQSKEIFGDSDNDNYDDYMDHNNRNNHNNRNTHNNHNDRNNGHNNNNWTGWNLNQTGWGELNGHSKTQNNLLAQEQQDRNTMHRRYQFSQDDGHISETPSDDPTFKDLARDNNDEECGTEGQQHQIPQNQLVLDDNDDIDNDINNDINSDNENENENEEIEIPDKWHPPQAVFEPSYGKYYIPELKGVFRDNWLEACNDDNYADGNAYHKRERSDKWLKHARNVIRPLLRVKLTTHVKNEKKKRNTDWTNVKVSRYFSYAHRKISREWTAWDNKKRQIQFKRNKRKKAQNQSQSQSQSQTQSQTQPDSDEDEDEIGQEPEKFVFYSKLNERCVQKRNCSQCKNFNAVNNNGTPKNKDSHKMIHWQISDEINFEGRVPKEKKGGSLTTFNEALDKCNDDSVYSFDM